MRRIIFIVLAVYMFLFTGRLFGGDQPAVEDEPTKLQRDYVDVLALQGMAKAEILTIAKILRGNPKIATDQTAASGEYCLNSGSGTMVHFATRPEQTPEDIVYEFDASGLIAAGLDVTRLQRLPERGQMNPASGISFPKASQTLITGTLWPTPR